MGVLVLDKVDKIGTRGSLQVKLSLWFRIKETMVMKLIQNNGRRGNAETESDGRTFRAGDAPGGGFEGGGSSFT